MFFIESGHYPFVKEGADIVVHFYVMATDEIGDFAYVSVKYNIYSGRLEFGERFYPEENKLMTWNQINTYYDKVFLTQHDIISGHITTEIWEYDLSTMSSPNRILKMDGSLFSGYGYDPKRNILYGLGQNLDENETWYINNKIFSYDIKKDILKEGALTEYIESLYVVEKSID